MTAPAGQTIEGPPVSGRPKAGFSTAAAPFQPTATAGPNPQPIALAWSSLLAHLKAHRPSANGRAQADERPEGWVDQVVDEVPVTVLSGFLGAGKSTLLAALLTSPPAGTSIRAIVNDVGKLRFDPTLVAASSELRVELTNGCGCCEATGDLATALREAVASLDEQADPTSQTATPAAERNNAGRPAIVLEASGVADPYALAQLAEADQRLRLERIVTVVDGRLLAPTAKPPAREPARDPGAPTCDTGDPFVASHPLLRRQLDAAHVVVLSHADLLSEPELAAATDWLAANAPGRPVVASSPAAPAAHVLLGVAATGAHPSPVGPSPASTTGTSNSKRHQFSTLTVRQRTELPLKALREALDNCSPSIVRVKGTLATDAGPFDIQLTPGGVQLTAAASSHSDRDKPAIGQALIVASSSAAAAYLAQQLGA